MSGPIPSLAVSFGNAHSFASLDERAVGYLKDHNNIPIEEREYSNFKYLINSN